MARHLALLSPAVNAKHHLSTVIILLYQLIPEKYNYILIEPCQNGGSPHFGTADILGWRKQEIHHIQQFFIHYAQ